jgi:hypothetical protein
MFRVSISSLSPNVLPNLSQSDLANFQAGNFAQHEVGAQVKKKKRGKYRSKIPRT